MIDVVPTILEAASLPQLQVANRMTQRPIEGASMLSSLNSSTSSDRHQIQYFEMFSYRGIYFEGRFAGSEFTGKIDKVTVPLK